MNVTGKCLTKKLFSNDCKFSVTQMRFKGRTNTRDFFRDQFPSKKGRWEPFKQYSEMFHYTTESLIFHRTGGRGPNGKVWNHKQGGGVKREFRWVDFMRQRFIKDSTQVYEEKVVNILHDKYLRTATIALVIGGCTKRWIIAFDGVEKGQIITTCLNIPNIPIFGLIGNSHPIGALKKGTIVHLVEKACNEGAKFFRSAGTYGQIMDCTPDNKSVIIKGNDQRTHVLNKECMATVGRVSNIEHDKERFTTFGQKARFGVKQRSGVWHKKRVPLLKPTSQPVINPKSKEKSNFHKMVFSYQDWLPRTAWTDWPQSYYDDRVKEKIRDEINRMKNQKGICYDCKISQVDSREIVLLDCNRLYNCKLVQYFF